MTKPASSTATPATPAPPAAINALSHLIETVHRLRAPGGCPWDRAQTHQSLRPYLIEEAYEVLDVLDRISSPENLQEERTRTAFREELGDLLMQVLIHAEIAKETGVFDIFEVACALDEKLIRRHPHVFGEVKAQDADAAFQTWERQKAKEKSSRAETEDASVLDGVPRGLPALQRAARVIEKVSKVGFQWKDLQGPLEKVDEELREFQAEVRSLQSATSGQPELRQRLEGELGDLLFTLCNLAYFLKISPEDSLRGTLARFDRRFRHVEARLRSQGKTPDQSSLEEMDRYWNEAKASERQNG